MGILFLSSRWGLPPRLASESTRSSRPSSSPHTPASGGPRGWWSWWAPRSSSGGGWGASPGRAGSSRAPGLPFFRVARRALLVGFLASAGACELTEVTLAEPAELVVAEGFVRIRTTPRPGGLEDLSYVFLHRSLDTSGRPLPVEGAAVSLRLADGGTVVLPESDDPERCVDELVGTAPGTCYGPLEGAGILPGDRLELEVLLPGGGVLRGATAVPGGLELEGRPGGNFCHLPPARTLELVWSPSRGSWAYVAETLITGLGPVFEPRGVEVEDPLDLLGLALSAEDTTIVFPAEFGIFERADLEREVALLLQEGLPAGTEALVSVAAVDRNYVNWVRGGNFNPSGQVRIPSVHGDGTGFFGSAVVDWFRGVVTETPPSELDACPGG